MSPNDERRPAGAASSVNTAGSTTATLPQAADIPAQLRRRRAASWRCEPLDDGRRDPHDRTNWDIVLGELTDWSYGGVFIIEDGEPRLINLHDREVA